MNFQPNNTNSFKYFEMMIKNHHEEAKLFGYSIKYLQPTETENNTIFSESTAREFLDLNAHDFFYKLEEDSMYDGSELFGGFGNVSSYSNVCYIPIKFFTDADIEPIEGDIVFDNTDNIFFEVTKVDPLTETQTNLRINNAIFSRKLYLKQYKFGYKDKFDDALLEPLDDVFTQEDLDTLNDVLNTDIDDLDVVNSDSIDAIFGDLG